MIKLGLGKAEWGAAGHAGARWTVSSLGFVLGKQMRKSKREKKNILAKKAHCRAKQLIKPWRNKREQLSIKTFWQLRH